jgi:hypothetical protein
VSRPLQLQSGRPDTANNQPKNAAAAASGKEQEAPIAGPEEIIDVNEPARDAAQGPSESVKAQPPLLTRHHHPQWRQAWHRQSL